MWFKQVQIYQLSKTKIYSAEEVNTMLEDLAFSPCLPSMPDSAGWVPPVEDPDAPLVRTINNNVALCLQVEEKILPATVIRKEVGDAIKEIEASEGRKMRQKEKLDLKDQIMTTMLPRAFSKLTKVHGYIDNNNHWLILGTTNGKLTDKFLSMFKKSVTDDVFAPQLTNPTSIMTLWVKTQNYPSVFAVENACVLQDPNQEGRIVRCQQQNLFVDSIQSLIKDGCEVNQLRLSWQDRVDFVLAKDFTLRSIAMHDELIEQVKELEPETAQQQFDANFMIMCGTFSGLLNDLLDVYADQTNKVEMLKTG
jgi:recombination associated protein RdgC